MAKRTQDNKALGQGKTVELMGEKYNRKTENLRHTSPAMSCGSIP
ncbi:hypothetical protein JOC37_002063 [Desulfohalotomaculum tongense]|nr:hypothetical protein [Desulforadius tongensis]MBM7855658.1 hypothetical protein [Desulforadius tongensis]